MSDQNARRRLGKGLTGMLGTPVAIAPPAPDPVSSPSSPAGLGVIELATSSLVANQHQPREFFDDASMDELANSIKQHGVIQPILARRAPGSSPQAMKYEIIAGERRWRAAQKAGLGTVPVVVREVSEQESAEWALVENLQRQDLGPIERAHAFVRLGKEFGLTHAQIAERVGMDRSTIANFSRLIELEPEIQELLNHGKLSSGHGRALLAAPSGPGRIALARDAATGEWSVRRLERAASALSERRKKAPASPAPQVAGDQGSESIRIDLEKRVGEYLNTRVAIRTDGRGETGRMVIEFYSNEQFEGVLERIGFRS